ncbi:MAG: PTS sugar transporter subunit IIA [Planctomycetes bacterium]|nr:PTS sugar transporter subunit IIA [Planctomycetota bacterium]
MALNLDDAARLLGVSPATLRRWAREGQLGVLRPSGDYRFDESELRTWARSNGLRLREGAAGGRYSVSSTGASGEQPLTLALCQGGVLEQSEAGNRDALLRAMVETVPLDAGADRPALLAQLLAREELASTGLGEGIAVPHPRTPSSAYREDPVVMLALPVSPVDWESLDGQAVHAAFLLINPAPEVHLKILSRLAFVLRDPGFQSLLRKGADFAEILTAAARLEPRG